VFHRSSEDWVASLKSSHSNFTTACGPFLLNLQVVYPHLFIADLDFLGIVSQDEYFFEGLKTEPLLIE
jgi:hypothetical protein